MSKNPTRKPQTTSAPMLGVDAIPEVLAKFGRGEPLTTEEETLLGFPEQLRGKSVAQLQELQAQSKGALAEGAELFNSPGHQLIAGNIPMIDANGVSFTSSDLSFTIGSTTVCYADMVALAGDFFAGTSLAGISTSIGQSDPSQQPSVFADKFASMLNQSGGPLKSDTPVADLLKFFAVQTTIVQAAGDKYGTSSTWLGYALPITITLTNLEPFGVPDTEIATLSMENFFDYIAFTSAIGVWYWMIASYNFDHFGADAVAAYTVGHTAACQAAGAAQGSANPQSALMTAYMMNAYADHFLTDLFAPGHLRVPRVPLHGLLPYFGDRLAQMMHNEDNIMGLNLTRSLDQETWVGYGDTRAFDAVNADNVGRATEAVGYSIAEVYAAFQSQDATAPANKALQYAPDPGLVLADTTNHPPMFKVDGSGLQNRTPLSTTSSSTYEALSALTAPILYATYDAAPPYEFAWGGSMTIPGSACSSGGVAMVTWNEKLYVAWVDGSTGDDDKVSIASYDGTTWVTLAPPMENGANGGTNGAEPALAVYNGQLYLAWGGSGGDGIFISRTTDGLSWSNQAKINGSNPTKWGGPAMTVFNDMLYVAWCSHSEDSTGSADTMVYYNWMDVNGAWQPGFTRLQGPGTYENSPGIAGYSGNLWGAWMGYNYDGIYWAKSADGVGWSSQVPLAATASTTTKYGGVCLTTYGGELYAFWLQDGDTPQYSRFAMKEGESVDAPLAAGAWMPQQSLPNIEVDELHIAGCEFGEYLALAWVDDSSGQVSVMLGVPTVPPNA